MVFDSRRLDPDQKSADRFKESSVDVRFRRYTCYTCGTTSIYRYQVLQVRRRPEIERNDQLVTGPDEQRWWSNIPRYAEIPETIKCKNCGEVVGAYTRCVW